MRRLLLSLLTLTALAACDAGNPTLPGAGDPSALMMPLEDGGGNGSPLDMPLEDGPIDMEDGGGGGGTGGTGGSTTQFRLNATIQKHNGSLIDPDESFEAVATFERYVNGSWQRYDTSLSILCYVNNVLRDQDSESSADHLDVHFEQYVFSGLIVRCEYYGMNGAYHETRQLLFY